MQIVLLFAIIEGSIFKFLSLQQNSEKISFLPVLFVLQNSFFGLRGFSSSQQKRDVFLRTDITVYVSCRMAHIWISVSHKSPKAEVKLLQQALAVLPSFCKVLALRGTSLLACYHRQAHKEMHQ